MNQTVRILLSVSCVALLAGCASEHPQVVEVASAPGFWWGLLHGLISPISFFVSLLSDDIRMYASPNYGRWYDFGFMIGVSSVLGGSVKAT